MNQQIQDQYVQGTNPYDNKHVAECLCKGGTISYQVKKERSQHQWWMDRYYVQLVVPNIARKYSSSSKVALVLGHALLWRIMDPVQSKALPTSMVSTVWQQVQYFVLGVVFIFFLSIVLLLLCFLYFVSFITNSIILLLITSLTTMRILLWRFHCW